MAIGLQTDLRIRVEYEGPWREATSLMMKADKVFLDLDVVAAMLLRDQLSALLTPYERAARESEDNNAALSAGE